MPTAYLSIGSNIGDKIFNCEQAVERLRAMAGIKVRERSDLYLTQPVGGPVQDDYINGVLKIDTDIPPEKLLDTIKDIEKDMGRTHAHRNYPRLIDIDILTYDDVVLKDRKLVIPHPRMHERYFVLHGLIQVAPDMEHPVQKKTISELYNEVKG